MTDATFAGTVPAILRSEHHTYKLRPDLDPQGRDEWLPGVTSVLDVLDKSAALMHWASQQTAEAFLAVHDAPGVDSLLESVGREGVIRAVTSRASWKRDEAAQLGSAVHQWADQYVGLGTLPAVSDTARAYTEAYADWWKNSGWSVRLSEAAIVAPADPGVHTGWGGTLDLLCRDAEGKTVLADIKTGKGVYREVILQLAAYGMGRFISPLGSQDIYEMPRVDRYAVIHVTRDGVREVELSIGPNEWSAWVSILDLYNWTKTVKGRL